MNYLHKNNKDYYTIVLSDNESLFTKKYTEYFRSFSPKFIQSSVFDHSTIDTIKTTESQKYITNYFRQIYFSIESKRQYYNELQSKNYLTFNKSTFNEAFNYFINEIAPLHPSNLSIKVTVSNSIYFKFELEDNYIIRLEVFLDDHEKYSDKIDNSSLIIEKDSIQEYGCFCSPIEIFKKLNNYFPSEYNIESPNEFSTLAEKEYSLTI